MNLSLGNNQKQALSNNKNKIAFLLGCLFLIVFLFYSVISSLFFANDVSAAVFSNRKLTITDSRINESNVGYTFSWLGSTNTIRCVDISFCTTQSGSCTTPTGLDSTGTSKGSWSGLNASLWNLNNSTNGVLRLTYGVGESPSPANVSLEFLGVTNPSIVGDYNARIATFSDVTCLTPEDWGPSTFHILGGVAMTASIPLPYATIVFEGKTSPLAIVTILRNGVVTSTTQASSSGTFQKTLTGLSAGNYTFGLFSRDRNNRVSPTVNFTVTLVLDTTTTISGIFLPPTISLSPTVLGGGQIVNIVGEVFPKSQISLFIAPGNIVKNTTANSQGRWSFDLSTRELGVGQYTIRAKAVSPQGEQSDFSKNLSFLVQCRGADLNFDGNVDIFDLSILLYFWGGSNSWNACADINQDGNVNVVDFSIMMYQWTS